MKKSEPPKLVELPDDCLLSTLLLFDLRTLVALGRLCKRFKSLIENPSLWRFAVVSGQASQAIKLIEKGLIPRAGMIRGLALQDIVFPLSSVPESLENPIPDLQRTFHSSLESLFVAVGKRLEELHIEDNVGSEEILHRSSQSASALASSSSILSVTPVGLFSGADSLFEAIAQNCREIKRLSLCSAEQSEYVGDHNILKLTTYCSKVEEFRDEESFGVSNEAVKYMADGWKNLKSLELNTELESLTGSLSGNSDKRITETNEPPSPLGSEPIAPPMADGLRIFVSALSKLTSLEVLAIDHSQTNHKDGLSPHDVLGILEACPHLKGLEYFAPFEAYFDGEEEQDGGSIYSSWSTAPNQNQFQQQNQHQIIPQVILGASNEVDNSDAASSRTRTNMVPNLADSLALRSRRGSVGSSLFTFGINTKKFGNASMSVFSKDDDEGEEVTSLAPALPSPTAFGTHKVEFYGTWSSEDKVALRDRAARSIFIDAKEDFFRGKISEFFEILEGIANVCKARGVRLTLAWTVPAEPATFATFSSDVEIRRFGGYPYHAHSYYGQAAAHSIGGMARPAATHLSPPLYGHPHKGVMGLKWEHQPLADAFDRPNVASMSAAAHHIGLDGEEYGPILDAGDAISRSLQDPFDDDFDSRGASTYHSAHQIHLRNHHQNRQQFGQGQGSFFLDNEDFETKIDRRLEDQQSVGFVPDEPETDHLSTHAKVRDAPGRTNDPNFSEEEEQPQHHTSVNPSQDDVQVPQKDLTGMGVGDNLDLVLMAAWTIGSFVILEKIETLHPIRMGVI
ncbi:hypothetical protein HDU76_008698 [Blyttiomyces sp. JEL0837]|nr:hypothetical protein HDU76_008698 [Blyttiomyces sp. JEL0837]